MYPTFQSALEDLDHCLSVIHLFVTLPAVPDEILRCRRLSHEWQAYVSGNYKLRKSFISGKGMYYQAEIKGVEITWLTPHCSQQNLTISDAKMMNILLPSLQFLQAHLDFVLFKLYYERGLKYPLDDHKLKALAPDKKPFRKYVSLQWIFDCANARVLLAIGEYEPGREPPPHLSPFVDDVLEGYIPERAKEIKRYQEQAKKTEREEIQKHLDEVKMELKGIASSSASMSEKIDSEEMPEEKIRQDSDDDDDSRLSELNIQIAADERKKREIWILKERKDKLKSNKKA